MHTISPQAQALNTAISSGSTPLGACLSPMGQTLAFPPGIPAQAAQARDKEINATIGQITDGKGGSLPLPTMQKLLSPVDGDLGDRAVLYSPIGGLPELRERWQRWHRRDVGADKAASLPLVTVGLTHALSLMADIFGGPGRKVIIPSPFWGNYRHVFAVRTGAELITPPAFIEGRYNARAVVEACADLPAGEPVLCILNLPSNPAGYSLTVAERKAVTAALLDVAEARPITVICDDAYAGLVYDPAIPRRSMFWDLLDLHPNLAAVKIDGVTKELSFFGGRVGFLTFGVAAGSPAAVALESKVKHLIRATVGSPVAASQVMVLQKLRAPDLAEQVEGIRQVLEARAHAVSKALSQVDHKLLKPLTCNSGCFALVELADGMPSSEVIRHKLLDEFSTGLVAIAPKYLRIAFCSVGVEALPELVRRLELAVKA